MQPDVTIDLYKGEPYLFRKGSKVKHQLSVGEALALTFLSESGDVNKAKTACSLSIGNSMGKQWVDRVLERYWTYLGPSHPKKLNLSWLKRLNINRLRQRQTQRREAAPSSLTWLVTLSCNRKCPYCFYEVTSYSALNEKSPPDASFPLKRALEMVSEMSEIGVSNLHLTGGEPLLRKDLKEIITAATSSRIRTHLVTKFAITASQAKDLAAAGTTRITYSLDSTLPKETSVLTGSRNFWEEAIIAITAIMEAGIPIELNTVLTSININSLENLFKLAVQYGIPKLTLSTFRPQLNDIFSDNSLVLVPSKKDMVKIKLDELQEKYGHKVEIKFYGSSKLKEISLNMNQKICGVAFEELHLLPDGSVTHCHYLPYHKEMIIGSLMECTIQETWNSKRFLQLSKPSSAFYKGTECDGCSSFQLCENRGRCYYSAISRYGSLYEKDDFCLKGN
ncbi:MAG: radical SAM protein [Planctomycetes bacterium]|nr:radical SAM protein [Planctomycetota bacterium]